MNIPQHWIEVRIQKRTEGRQVTVRRWGWSSESEEAAREHAQKRADEALKRILKGEELPRREAKLAYGEAGMPIREEVLARIDDLVITRNSYGAHCLNVPNVLFADVDFARPGTGCALTILGGVAIAFLVDWLAPPMTLELRFVVFLVVLFVGGYLASKLDSATVGNPRRARGREKHRAEERIRSFADSHPDWLLRIYETPNGFRVVAAHRTFDPNDVAVAELFDALNTDPLYRRLCERQQCFRARLTAKPWRMGFRRRYRPRPGVWPVTDPEKLALRTAWVDEYEQRQGGYAACRYLHSLGAGELDESVERIVHIHDERSGALTDRPLA